MNHMHLLLVASSLIVLAGCSRRSMSPPPRIAAEFNMPQRLSVATVPVTLDIAKIAETLNQNAPTRLATIDQDRDACVPAKWADVCLIPKLLKSGCAQHIKTKITPAIDCHLSGRIDRGPIELFGDEAGLIVNVPIYASVSARGRGAIGKNIQETAKGSIRLTTKVFADVNERWEPRVTVEPNFHWIERPYVRVLGFEITFGSKVEPQINKAFASLESELSKQLSKIDIKGSAEKLWHQGFAPVLVSSKPDVWLRLQPKGVGLSKVSTSDGNLRFVLKAEVLADTFVGPKPPSRPITQLPDLQKDITGDEFDIFIPVFADYDALEKQVSDALSIGSSQSVDIPLIGKSDVTFLGVDIYPSGKDALAIGLELTADTPGTMFDTRGKLWIVGHIEVDNASKRIIPTGIDYGSNTDNEAFDTLFAVLRAPSIKERIRKALVYDFSRDYEKSLRSLNAILNNETNGIYLAGNVLGADLSGITNTAYGAYTALEVKGNISVGIAPSSNIAQPVGAQLTTTLQDP